MPTRSRAGMQACLRDLLLKITQRLPAKQAEATAYEVDQHSKVSLPGMDELQSRPCVIMSECKPPRQRGSGRFGVIVGHIILTVEWCPAAATTLPTHCRTIMRRRARPTRRHQTDHGTEQPRRKTRPEHPFGTGCEPGRNHPAHAAAQGGFSWCTRAHGLADCHSGDHGRRFLMSGSGPGGREIDPAHAGMAARRRADLWARVRICSVYTCRHVGLQA